MWPALSVSPFMTESRSFQTVSWVGAWLLCPGAAVLKPHHFSMNQHVLAPWSCRLRPQRQFFSVFINQGLTHISFMWDNSTADQDKRFHTLMTPCHVSTCHHFREFAPIILSLILKQPLLQSFVRIMELRWVKSHTNLWRMFLLKTFFAFVYWNHNIPLGQSFVRMMELRWIKIMQTSGEHFFSSPSLPSLSLSYSWTEYMHELWWLIDFWYSCLLCQVGEKAKSLFWSWT